MMQARQMEFVIMRYAPVATSPNHLNVGIILFEKMAEGLGFVEARFIDDIQQVSDFDQDADLELLQSVFREIKQKLSSFSDREVALQMLRDTFSNVLQVVGPMALLVSGDPLEEVDRLSAFHLARRT